MLLNRIEINNFRQLRSITYDFLPGVTAIIGANGSGKTSLLEAITWCLFGEQRDKKETLRSLWAEGKSKTSVKLEFSLNDSIYQVSREEDDATLKRIYPDPKVLSVKLKPVTAGVEKLLNMTYEQFKNSYLTEQKDLKFLQFSSALRQRDEIAKMLGYNRLGSASKMAKERGKSFADQARGLELSLSMMEEHEKEIKEKSSAMSILATELLTIEKKIIEIQPAIIDAVSKANQATKYQNLSKEIEIRKDIGRTLSKQMELAKMRADEASKLKDEKKNLKPKSIGFEQIEKEYRSLLEMQKDEGTKSEVEKRLNALRLESDKLLKELANIPKSDAREVQAKLISLEEEMKSELVAKNTLADEIRLQETEREKQMATLSTQLSSVTEDLAKKEISFADGKCPTCGKPWTEKDKSILDDLLETKVKLQSTYDSISKRIVDKSKLIEQEKKLESLASSIKNYTELLQAAKLNGQKRADIQNRKQATETDIMDNTSRLKTLETKFDSKRFSHVKQEMEELRPHWQRFQQLANVEAQGKSASEEYEKLNLEFLAEKQSHATLNNELKELVMTNEDATIAITLFDNVKKEADFLANSKMQLQIRIEEQQASIASIQKTIDKLKSQKKVCEELLSSAELHKEVETALNKLRELISEQTKPLLEQIASNYLQTLTSGRYSRLILSEKYEATVFDDEHQKPVISGGEEDVVALALRLALAQVIQERSGQPMGLLMLDEVFGSLDADRRNSVMEQIDALRGTFEQILVISHIDSINDSADRCVEVRYDPQTRQSAIQEVVGEFALQ